MQHTDPFSFFSSIFKIVLGDIYLHERFKVPPTYMSCCCLSSDEGIAQREEVMWNVEISTEQPLRRLQVNSGQITKRVLLNYNLCM